MNGFEELLEGTVREMANPELPAGFAERVMTRVTVDAAVTLELSAAWLRQESVLASLWGGLYDLVSPKRLPPLVLASQPVPVADPLAERRSSRSVFGAVLAHAVVILVIAWVVEARVGLVRTVKPEVVVGLDVMPPKLQARAVAAGGGGGQRGPTPVAKGHLPKFAEQQIVPPMAPPLEQPKISVEPTVEVQKDLKMTENALPNLGIPNSPVVGASMGNGRGAGIGSGDGDGIGPGRNGNTGGGIKHVGGGVSKPELLYFIEPEFSEEARRAKFAGNVLVYLWVDSHGNPTHIRVAQSVGLGLDEKAMEAVRQYRFKPAMENGRPVTVEMYVDVNFTIY